MSDSGPCELCDKNPGEFSCESCDMDNLCAACDADLHRNAKQASHRRKISATGEYVQLAAAASGVPASSPSSTSSAAAAAAAEALALSPTGRGGLGLQSGSLRNNMPRPSINLLAPRPPPRSLLGAIHEHGGAAPSKIKNRASVTLAFQVMKGEQLTPEAVGVPPSDEPFVKMCDICSSAPAAQYCPQCQRFSCMECDHTTHKSSAMKGHARMPYPPVFNKTPSGPTSPISETSAEQEEPAASGAPQLSVAIESPSNALISISAPSPLARSSISPALAALAAQPRAGLNLGAPGGGRNTRAMSVMAPVSSKPLIQLPIRTGGGASTTVSASAGTAATPAPTCDICEDSVASVWCPECKMNLCISNNCDQELHTPAKTKWHVRSPLGEALNVSGESTAATTTTPPATTSPVAVASPVDSSAATAAANATSTLSTPAAVSLAASSLLASPQLNRPRASSVMLKSPPLALPKPPGGGAAGMLNLPSLPSSTTSSLHASPDATARTARGSRLCEICEVHPAALYCAACPMYMCAVGGCDAQLHAPAKLAHHFRAPMPKSKCSICEEQEGDVWCFDCAKHYCSASNCDRDYHQPAKNAAHRRENVGKLHAVDSAAPAAVATATATAAPEPKMNIVVTPEESTPSPASVPVSHPAAVATASATTTTKPTTPPTAAVIAPVPAAVVAAPAVAPAVPAARVFPQGAGAPAKPTTVTPPAAATTPTVATTAATPVAANPTPAAAAPATAAPKSGGGAFSSLISQLLPSTTPVAAPKSNIFVVCDSCDVSLAALVCEQCRAEDSVVVEQFFCVACDKRRHPTASKRESHRRRAILKTDTQRPADPLVKAAASVALAIPDIASVLAQSPNHSPQSSPPMSRKASPRKEAGTAAIVPSPLLAVAAPVTPDYAQTGGAVSVVKSLPECDRCSKPKASIYCEDCELNLDAACFAELHKSSAAKLHPKKNLVEQGSASAAAAAVPAAVVPIQALPSLLSLKLTEPPPKPAVVPVTAAAPAAVPVVVPVPAVVPVVVAAAKPPAAAPKKVATAAKPATSGTAKPAAAPRAASTTATTKAVEESKSASPVHAPLSISVATASTTSPPKPATSPPAVKPKPKVPVQAKPAAVTAADDTTKLAAVTAPAAEAKENGPDAAPVAAAKPKPAAKPAPKPAVAKKPAASPAATPAASPTNAASASAAVAPVPAVPAASEPVAAPQQPKATVSVTSEPLPPIVVAAAAPGTVAAPAAATAAPRSKSPAIPKLNLATPALAALASAAPLHPSALLPAPPMSSRSDTSADSSSSSSSSSDDESARKKRGGNSKKSLGAAKPATVAGAGPAAAMHHHAKSEDFAVDDLALLTARSAALAKQKKAEAKAEAKAKVRAIVEAKHAAEKAPAVAAAPVDPASKLASLEKSLQSRVATLEHSLQESVQLKSARIHSARTEAIIQSLKATGVIAPSAAPAVTAASNTDASDSPEAMAAIRMELFNARTQLAQFQQLAQALSFQLQFGAAPGGMHHPMAAAGGMGGMWPFMMNMAASPSHGAATASPLAAAGPLPPKLSMLSSLPAPFQKELQELVASTVAATLAASPSHARTQALQSSARSEEEFDPYAASRLRAKYTTINDSVHEANKAEQKAAERASESAPELSRPATAYPASASSSSSMLSHHSGTSTPIKATRLSSAPSSGGGVGGSGLTPAQLQAREAARARMGATAPVVPLAFEPAPAASVPLSTLPAPSSKKVIVPRRRNSNQSSEEEREATGMNTGASETDTDRSSVQDTEIAASHSKRRLAPLVSRPASASTLRSALKPSSRASSASRKSHHADGSDSTADENDAVVFLAPSQRGAANQKQRGRSGAPSTAHWSEEDSDQEQFEAEIAAGDDDDAHPSSATSSLIARYREEALGAMRGTPSSRKSPQPHQQQSPTRLKLISNHAQQQQQQYQQQHEASPSAAGHSRSLSSDRRRAREEKRHQSLEAQLQLERAYRAEEAARNVTLRAALRSLQYEKEEAVSAVQAAQWVSRQADDDAREEAEVQRRAQLAHAQIDQARWDSTMLFPSQAQQPPPALPTPRTLSKLMQAQLYASTQPAREAQLLAHRRSASVAHSSGPPSPLQDYASAAHYRSPESSVNAYYQQQAAAQQHQAHYLAQLHFSPLGQQQPQPHHLHPQQQQHHHPKYRGHMSHSASAGSLQAMMMRPGSATGTGSSPQSGAQRAMERVYSAATLPVYRPTVRSPKPIQDGWM